MCKSLIKTHSKTLYLKNKPIFFNQYSLTIMATYHITATHSVEQCGYGDPRK